MTTTTTTRTATSPAGPARHTTATARAAATSRDLEHLYALLRRLTGDEKHAASAHSTLDVLWVLYDRILRISPETVEAQDRDRFLLSKGHGPAAYYAVLAAKGFIPESWLDDLAGPDSPLGHHPDRLLVPGVEIGSGSLGHGLGLGVGVALGLRAQGLTGDGPGRDRSAGDGSGRDRPAGDAPSVRGSSGPRVYVLLGDAELDEGSNHEAIAYAGATGLGQLTAIVVDNSSATHGWPGGIASRFTVNGWTASVVDGRDHEAIAYGLSTHQPGRPHVVVATVESSR